MEQVAGLDYEINTQRQILKSIDIRFFLFFVSCIFLVQCSHEEIPVYNCTELNQVDIIADTLLFKDIKCLTFHGNKLYFTNTVANQIISLDKNLNLVKAFGKKGQGPGELLGVNKFAVRDTLISVFNGGNRKINIFSTDGEVVSEVRMSNSFISYNTRSRYCFIDSSIIGNAFLSDPPLFKYNMYTEEQILFGKTYTFSSPKQTSIRNGRHVLKIDKGFIAVSNNLPYIEIYNQDDLEQIVQYDYSGIKQVRKSIQAIESKTDKADNTFHVLCEDIYVANKHLYILLSDFSNDDYNVNQVIKFEIYPVIKPVSIFKLPGKIFLTFCVSEEDNVIYAYEYKKNIIGAYSVNHK